MATSIDDRAFTEELKTQLTIDKVCEFTNKKVPVQLWTVNGATVSIPLSFARKNGLCSGTKTQPLTGFHLNEKFSLREYQREEMAKCLDTLRKYHTLMLNVRCAWGKTPSGIYLLSELGGRCMVLVENSLIQTGWASTLADNTDADVVVIEGGNDYSCASYSSQKCVFLCTVQTLANIPNNHMPRDITTLFVDEVRRFCTEIRIRQMLRIGCEYMIGASADVDRTDGMHQALKFFLGEQGGGTYITSIWSDEFDYVRIFTDLRPEVRYTQVGWGPGARSTLDWKAVQDSIADSRGFCALLADAVSFYRGEKVLVLTKYRRQAAEVYKLVAERKMDAVLVMGDLMSKTGKLKTHPDADVVVATISMCGVGYDLAKVAKGWDGRHFSVVVAGFDMTTPEQAFGRGFRHHHPTIVDFIHRLPKLREHAQLRESWCLERNARIFDHHVGMASYE